MAVLMQPLWLVLVYTNGILQWILSLCCTARSVTYVDTSGMMLFLLLIFVGLLLSECTAGPVSPALPIFSQNRASNGFYRF